MNAFIVVLVSAATLCCMLLIRKGAHWLIQKIEDALYRKSSTSSIQHQFPIKKN